jgi:glycosyltransferase involved in cell wall biosynthesis
MSSTTIPLISVVMPVRNGARWLSEAIESIIYQTCRDFELLVIDDGSTDETPEILTNWLSRDSRIRVLRQNERGLVAALNYGLDEARGSLIARHDADDRAIAHRLERQIRVLGDNPRVGLLGAWAQRIDAHGRARGYSRPETRPERITDVLARTNPFIHSTVIFRTEIARRLGGYRAAFEAAEDYDLWLRMSEITQLANAADVLVQYRRHDTNVSARKAIRQSFSVRLAQRATGIRRQTGRDPAIGMTTAPDWRTAHALDTFYGKHAVIYRLLDLADPECSAGAEHIDFSPLVERLSELNHAERRLAALAIINYLRRAPAGAFARTGRTLVQMLWRRPGMALLAARALSNRSRHAPNINAPNITDGNAGEGSSNV